MASHASIAARGSKGPRAPVQGLPLHHGIFQKNAIFINLRAVAVEYDKIERDSFLKDDLGLKSEDVRDIFEDPSTLLLHLVLATPTLCTSVLDRLFAVVPWTAVNGNPVFGWAAAEPLVTVRVMGVPRGFPAEDLRRHFESFDPISQFYRTPDRSWSSASKGVFLISLRVGHGVALPQGALWERFAVYFDGRRRHCFRCGGPGHLGAFCKASCLAPEAKPTLWSSLIYAGPVLAPATMAALATSDQASSPAADTAATSPAADVVAASVAINGMASSAASASPTVAVAMAPSAAATPVAAPTVYVTAASTPAASAAPSAADDAASINLAAAVVAASDTIVTAPGADVGAAVPLHDRSGSASSASDMSGAEEEGSAAGGFSLPRRKKERARLAFPFAELYTFPPLLVQKCSKMPILIICSSHFCNFALPNKYWCG
jgi:hypothetical protein